MDGCFFFWCGCIGGEGKTERRDDRNSNPQTKKTPRTYPARWSDTTGAAPRPGPRPPPSPPPGVLLPLLLQAAQALLPPAARALAPAAGGPVDAARMTVVVWRRRRRRCGFGGGVVDSVRRGFIHSLPHSPLPPPPPPPPTTAPAAPRAGTGAKQTTPSKHPPHPIPPTTAPPKNISHCPTHPSPSPPSPNNRPRSPSGRCGASAFSSMSMPAAFRPLPKASAVLQCMWWDGQAID